jgi:hypothetical protein
MLRQDKTKQNKTKVDGEEGEWSSSWALEHYEPARLVAVAATQESAEI